ncbi:MAG: transporter substrate-binding domain-containing protein [Paracoccaceae bacterium]|nr:transporter substrate-binding domain-containing protein [Paracoccaceae bacterium]
MQKSIHVLIVAFAMLMPFTPSFAKDQVSIGVRVDTPPFVSIDTNSGAYVGYFYDICTEAVTRAGYQFTEKAVNAIMRDVFLNTGDGGYDVLCDPTTITLARMKNFADTGEAKLLGFSQIIFVANGGYVMPGASMTVDSQKRLGDHRPDGTTALTCETLFSEAKDKAAIKATAAKATKPADGLDGKQPPNTEIAEDEEAKSWRNLIQFRYKRPEPTEDPAPQTITSVQVLGYVSGSTISEKVVTFEADFVEPIACTFSSHRDAAEAFCQGKLDRYYGDLDILRASIGEHRDKTGLECPVEFADPEEYTYEPYAFVISSEIEGFHEKFSCALYSMFEDGTIESLYTGRFDAQMSSNLSILFRINNIPIGKHSGEEEELSICGIDRSTDADENLSQAAEIK